MDFHSEFTNLPPFSLQGRALHISRILVKLQPKTWSSNLHNNSAIRAEWPKQLSDAVLYHEDLKEYNKKTSVNVSRMT